MKKQNSKELKEQIKFKYTYKGLLVAGGRASA